MPTVQSRRNGLIVNIPPDARGVVGRFNTQGDNELIFAQNNNARADTDAVKIGGEKPRGARKQRAAGEDLA